MPDHVPTRRDLRRFDDAVAAAERRSAELDPPEPLEEAEEVAREAWRQLIGEDGYLPVLLLLFFAMISGPLLGDSELGKIFTIVVTSGAYLLTVFRSSRRPKVRRYTTIIASVATGVTVVAVLSSSKFDVADRDIAIVVSAAFLVLLLGAFPLVLVRSFQHRKVTVNTVCATLSAYILIGLIFTSLYRLLDLVAPPFFAQTAVHDVGKFSYFSFITLTTVGYGDLSPGTDPGRAFVMVEAVLGQVFLVTTMARVVSLLGEERRGFEMPTMSMPVPARIATRSGHATATTVEPTAAARAPMPETAPQDFS